LHLPNRNRLAGSDREHTETQNGATEIGEHHPGEGWVSPGQVGAGKVMGAGARLIHLRTTVFSFASEAGCCQKTAITVIDPPGGGVGLSPLETSATWNRRSVVGD
jgi:hypothetical protein